ncbi:hypothetical protein BKA63DRAFT_514286 [Paraphoma chrysanthemicola]|nr:hypothetical protein BKA63DRAFT_514286 [Paraphoma chrysanthemicola]
MSNRLPSSEFHKYGRSHNQGHGDLSMDYINRALEHFSRSPRRHHHSPRPHSSPSTKHFNSRQQSHSRPVRHHRHKHRRDKMTFGGPWSTDLEEFKKSVQSMPNQYKSSFASASKETLEKVCDADVLHIWETDSDIDNLIQLASVIVKLCSLGKREDEGSNAKDGSMIIIAEEKSNRNNFARVCQLVEHLTCASGKTHLERTVAAFGSIVVVKGWNNSVRSENVGKEAEQVVKRINIAIERVFKIGNFAGRKKVVWHHGPVIHFLLHWINHTTSTLRSTLQAISVNGSLDLTDSVKPSAQGRSNTLSDLSTLESYAKKLDIPVVFLDPSSQLINYHHLATYMYYHAYYMNTFLPTSLSRPHLHKAQDDLVTFAFQILGASRSKYGDSMVKLVKDRLDPGKAKKWARNCVDPRSYEKAKCRAAGREPAIHRAVQTADGPFTRFNHNSDITAFARLAVGPAAACTISQHTAAPVSIDYKSSRLRPAHPATFHILIPSASQDLEKVTNSIQGLMMAVLSLIIQEKGAPTIGSDEVAMWKEVVKACTWALDNAKGKMPKSVEEKVKYVTEKLTSGCWGQSVGMSSNSASGKGKGVVDGMSEAAKANQDAVKAYGLGGNMYGQVPQTYAGIQGGMGIGMPGPGQQQQYATAQGLTAPPNSPGMGPPQAMYPLQNQAYGQGMPPQAYGGIFGDGHAQSQGVGGSGGARYPPQPQSMGGPWI